MAQQIIPFRSSINTCYLIKDKGAILIDAGYPDLAQSFSKFLHQHEIEPGEIQLIVITHGEEGIFHWPEGVTPWGRVSRAMFKPLMKAKADFPPVKADLVLGDNDQSLEEFGIAGKIIYTPGHTYGSVSVLLETGDAFIGCLAHNRAPFVFKPSLPIYAKDIDLLKKSWKKVIDQGAKSIYPGHGKSFPVEKILKYLN